jgi:hypothetical protein
MAAAKLLGFQFLQKEYLKAWIAAALARKRPGAQVPKRKGTR